MRTDPFARKSSGGVRDSPVPAPPEAVLERLLAELQALKARAEAVRA